MADAAVRYRASSAGWPAHRRNGDGMAKLSVVGALTLVFFVSAVAKAQSPDLSGTWYSIDPTGPDNAPINCVPTQDIGHLVAINNGVNPIHIFADKAGRATRIEFGDGPFATVYARSAASCVAYNRAKEAQFMQGSSTVTVEPDLDK